MKPLELLYEPDGLAAFDLPGELAALYGGSLGFDEPRLFANFVATIDGVVAIPSVPSLEHADRRRERDRPLRDGAPARVRGRDRDRLGNADRRAGLALDARAGVPGRRRAASPSSAAASGVRRRRSSSSSPAAASSTPRIPRSPQARSSSRPTRAPRGSRAGLPAATTVVSLGAGPELDPAAIVTLLRERGHRLILSEGGPHAVGRCSQPGSSTSSSSRSRRSSPAGRRSSSGSRSSRAPTCCPAGLPEAELLGVRRDGGHLFLRYELGRSGKDHERT